MKRNLLLAALLTGLNSYALAQGGCGTGASWARAAGEAGSDLATKIAVDPAGNTYVTGDFNGTFVFDNVTITGRGEQDMFLARYSPDGQLQWIRTFGGELQESSRALTLDNQGNVYLAGSFRSGVVAFSTDVTVRIRSSIVSSLNADIFVAKFTPAGQVVWARSAGGQLVGNDGAYGVGVDDNGNVTITGVVTSAITFSSPRRLFGGLTTSRDITISFVGNNDVFLANYNSAGELQWAKGFGTADQDYSFGLGVNKSSGESFITGFFTGSRLEFDENSSSPPDNNREVTGANGADKLFLARFSNAGVNLWARSPVSNAAVTGVGGIGNIDVGTSQGWGLAVDGAGNPTVAATYTGTLTAGTLSPLTDTKTNVAVLRYGSDGTPLWALKAGSTVSLNSPVDPRVSASVRVSPGGDGYVVSSFQGDLIFGTQPVISASARDMFLGQFNNQGQSLSASRSLSVSPASVIVADVGMDAQGNAYLAGYYSGGEAKIGANTFPVNGTRGNSDLWFARIVNPQAIQAAADFTFQKGFCSVKFFDQSTIPPAFTVVSRSWSFGDATGSNETNPLKLYAGPGTYTVTLTVNFRAPGCPNTIPSTRTRTVVFRPTETSLRDTIVQVQTTLAEEVLSASASEFSDAWPLRQPTQALRGKSGFANGTQGVWRTAADHGYDDARRASTPVNVAKDGTFTLEQFSWATAQWDILPKWRRMNTITQYSPYGYELENRDILGRFSAALYDYGGQFPSANGVNMGQLEMGYTGFEYQEGNTSGNWRLLNAAVDKYKIYRVFGAIGNTVLLNADLSEFDNVTRVTAIVSNQFSFIPRPMALDVAILCKRRYAQNPTQTVLEFDQSISDFPWSGSIVVTSTPQNEVVATLDPAVAHTGKQSMRVAAPLTLRQERFELVPGKTYTVSAWVSVNNASLATPSLGSGIALSIVFRNGSNTQVARTDFQPAGNVLEGWQQLQGNFTCPPGITRMEVVFTPRSGADPNTWFDDLRLHPTLGNMKSYVYELNSYRLLATLDENNYASLYYYDEEGRLYLTKKETVDGIKTIAETVTHSALPRP